MESSPEKAEETIARLIEEVRHLRSTLEEVQSVLYTERDMDVLSIKGAAAYLVRQKRILEDARDRLRRASKKPEDAVKILCDLERIVLTAEK